MGVFDDIIAKFSGGPAPSPTPVAQTFAQVGLGRAGVDRVRQWSASEWAKYIKNPVAQTRITRTPVYAVSGANWPETQAGEFVNSPGRINIKDEDLQKNSNWVLPHESAHAIFDQAKLYGSSAQLLKGMRPGGDAMERVTSHPELYGSNPSPETIANEGLAYSIPYPSGGPYVNYMSSQIKDPVLAQQLQRLHANATASYSAPMQMMEKIGSKIQELFAIPPLEKDQ